MDFNRSHQLFSNLFVAVSYPLYDDSPRTKLSKDLALVTINLVGSIHVLCSEKQFTGAGILLRSQYESFVRSVWAYYCASDIQVEKLSSNLTLESLQATKNIPLVAEMLTQLEKSPMVAGLLPSLHEFKQSSWLPLNSLVHGGLFSIHGTLNDYEPKRLETIFLNANGITLLAFIQLGLLTRIEGIQQRIYSIAADFEDCLPPRRK